MLLPVFIKEWCNCSEQLQKYKSRKDDWGQEIFRDDDECECGTSKHHYHCPFCGGITQVG